MIYILENTDKLEESVIKKYSYVLSEQRKEKINNYGSVRDRINGGIVYMLLRYALINEYSYCHQPVFSFGEHEKPYLSDRGDIFFNMSHCRNAVCCIVSDSDTAIDITDIRIVKPNIINRVCSDKEKKLVSESTDPQRSFLRLWTRKECLSKLSGKGMSEGFKGLTDELPQAEGLHTAEDEEYIYTYYSPESEKAVVMHDGAELLSFFDNCSDTR